jgi:hypothetical protein
LAAALWIPTGIHPDEIALRKLIRSTVPEGDQANAYLESTSPGSVRLYQRHGFELLGTIQVGSSPQLFPMVRKPRPISQGAESDLQDNLTSAGWA